MQLIGSKAVKRDKAAEAALKKRQQARQMLERMKELEQELDGVSYADLNKIASLKAKQKLGETISKMQDFTDLADALNG